MQLRNIFEPLVESRVTESASIVRRRRAVVAGTLILGTAILAGTLAAPAGSALFYALGVLAAVTWIMGAVLSGPIPMRRPRGAMPLPIEIAASLLLGATFFGAFLVAKLLADHLPLVSGSVASVLAAADAGPRVSVLAIALVNGIGEEMLFRGSLQTSFVKDASVWTVAIYCLVTIATLNAALVVAALVMGAVFSAERRATGGVLAPILTHMTWSTLMLLLLPR
jgi:membrane protease YdiL (CAAX protease family)